MGEDRWMLTPDTILLFVTLLLCNLIYCSQRVMADLRRSRRGQAIWGFMALVGALIALGVMIWAALASLAYL